MKFDASRAAFLAIDLQQAFCTGTGSVARQGRDITPCRDAALRCIELADAARRNGIPVIWTKIALRPDYADGGLMIHEIRPGLKEAGGIKAGTDDAALIAEAVVAPGDFVIDKPRNSAFFSSSLESLLHALDVRCLLMGGVTTSMCVESTARDAGQRDYRTFVVRDACGDFAQARHDAALDAIAFGFGRVISGNEAFAALDAGEADF
ncbi:MAG: cysteine hydrolase [Proteobacteria bacterium]|nr:cysteine hydrolase [Pseudomonadota bacterium]MDA1057657.1 cysteine hydrolase [Pseudomonadota bacterium]